VSHDGDALHPSLQRRFEALIFDWDSTGVLERHADAPAVRGTIEAMCSLGLDVAVVSSKNLANIEDQFDPRPRGPGELHLLLNSGSEVFRVGATGPALLERRSATDDEDVALDLAVARTIELLGERGLYTRILSRGLNRREIDLSPGARRADPPNARTAARLEGAEARLRKHGLDGLSAPIALAEAAARAAGLKDVRLTSDAKHLEMGLTDKSDSARWWIAHLWERGIWPEQLLIVGGELGPLGGLAGSDSKLLIAQASGATVASVGIEPAGLPTGVIALGGGPAQLVRLLRTQLRLRRQGALPIVPNDPRWTLRVDRVIHEHERAYESLLTVADGCLGTRGSVLGRSGASRPAVVIAGAYRGRGERSELQPAPLWNRLAIAGLGGRVRRTLDLHSGLLAQERPGLLAALQFSSLADPGLAVLRAVARRDELEASPALLPPRRVRPQFQQEGTSMRVKLTNGVLEAAGAQSIRGIGASQSSGATGALERIAAYALTSRTDGARPAARRLRLAQSAGSERLLIEHRCAWAQRWARADVRIEGDPALQKAVRLALYHLMSSTADRGEAAVGARGLSGDSYRGHVFWDSDVFVLPFLAATHPASARAILEYRVRRLPAAQDAARARGLGGARFAWESAGTGEDVTPRQARDRAGREVAIYTGQREEHIVADVAWAAACYSDWTGDERFRTGPGRRLLVETARYWASRIERQGDGSAHIGGVIGPDEYHEEVDDNAYTNVMARWNLRRAFRDTTRSEIDEAERASWLELAEELVDGYCADTRVYEQFAGFFDLEPAVIADLAPRRPIAADLLLGRERVHRAQVVKQADVLMLHHLVPQEVVPGSLDANLDFYEPRTAHASSLSPGVHAGLFARAGRFGEALRALSLATRIDLDDISASTAAGVHIAAMGSVWQALAYGFLGARPHGETLELDPRLPAEWEALGLRLRFRETQLSVRVTAGQIELSSDRPARVSVSGARPVIVDANGYVGEWASPGEGRTAMANSI
jgi:trehalose/maltose hydrolase-like predicted phosphorylase